MEVNGTVTTAAETPADTLVVGVFVDEEPADPAIAELVASGEAKRTHGAIGLTHRDGRRLLAAGLGERAALDPSARAQAQPRSPVAPANWARATSAGRCRTAATRRSLRRSSRARSSPRYRFERYREQPADADERPPALDELTVASPLDLDAAVARAQSSARPRTRRARCRTPRRTT